MKRIKKILIIEQEVDPAPEAIDNLINEIKGFPFYAPGEDKKSGYKLIQEHMQALVEDLAMSAPDFITGAEKLKKLQARLNNINKAWEEDRESYLGLITTVKVKGVDNNIRKVVAPDMWKGQIANLWTGPEGSARYTVEALAKHFTKTEMQDDKEVKVRAKTPIDCKYLNYYYDLARMIRAESEKDDQELFNDRAGDPGNEKSIVAEYFLKKKGYNFSSVKSRKYKIKKDGNTKISTWYHAPDWKKISEVFPGSLPAVKALTYTNIINRSTKKVPTDPKAYRKGASAAETAVGQASGGGVPERSTVYGTMGALQPGNKKWYRTKRGGVVTFQKWLGKVARRMPAIKETDAYQKWIKYQGRVEKKSDRGAPLPPGVDGQFGPGTVALTIEVLTEIRNLLETYKNKEQKRQNESRTLRLAKAISESFKIKNLLLTEASAEENKKIDILDKDIENYITRLESSVEPGGVLPSKIFYGIQSVLEGSYDRDKADIDIPKLVKGAFKRAPTPAIAAPAIGGALVAPPKAKEAVPTPTLKKVVTDLCDRGATKRGPEGLQVSAYDAAWCRCHPRTTLTATAGANVMFIDMKKATWVQLDGKSVTGSVEEFFDFIRDMAMTENTKSVMAPLSAHSLRLISKFADGYAGGANWFCLQKILATIYDLGRRQLRPIILKKFSDKPEEQEALKKVFNGIMTASNTFITGLGGINPFLLKAVQAGKADQVRKVIEKASPVAAADLGKIGLTPQNPFKSYMEAVGYLVMGPMQTHSGEFYFIHEDGKVHANIARKGVLDLGSWEVKTKKKAGPTPAMVAVVDRATKKKGSPAAAKPAPGTATAAVAAKATPQLGSALGRGASVPARVLYKSKQRGDMLTTSNLNLWASGYDKATLKKAIEDVYGPKKRDILKNGGKALAQYYAGLGESKTPKQKRLEKLSAIMWKKLLDD